MKKVGEKTKEIRRKDVRVFRRCELLQKVSEMKAWKQPNKHFVHVQVC